jgi:condensin complex subunit 1
MYSSLIVIVIAILIIDRKSTSLAPATRQRLVTALCESVQTLSRLLHTVASRDDSETVPQAFRDAFSCHLYMLFCILFFIESEAKSEKLNNTNSAESNETLAVRSACADAMLAGAQAMGKHRAVFWQRGVPDETVVVLPCRIAYQMLERATGVLARKAACAEQALGMIACTVDSADCILSTVTAALMDLLHSYEHMAGLTAELCVMVSENPTNRLAVELLREIGRLDGGGDGRASGIKHVAPFLSELAAVRPRLVLANLSYILPHLDSEPYNMRSSIVTAVAHILTHLAKQQQQQQQVQQVSTEGSSSSPASSLGEDNNPDDTADDNRHAPLDVTKSRTALLDLLMDRIYDVSSFTRATVLKAWISLTVSGSLPKERVLPLTRLAMDRLQDKTVMVRKQSMHVRTIFCLFCCLFFVVIIVIIAIVSGMYSRHECTH